MKRFLFLRFLLLFCMFVGSTHFLECSDHKDEEMAAAPTSVTPEAPPSSFVNSVHVASGAFYFSTHDLTVPGPCPLDITHNYNSETAFYTWLGFTPFAFNFPVALTGFQVEKNKKNAWASVNEANGSALSIAGRGHKDSHDDSVFYLDIDIIKKGFTNCNGGEISARTNIKNSIYKLHASKADKHSKGAYQWKALLSDGSERTYNRVYDLRQATCLDKEKKPSGHVLDFSYQKSNYVYEFKKIKALSPDEKRVLGWVSFDANFKKLHADIKTSNGKSAHYELSNKLFQKQRANLIKSITSSDAPDVRFHYNNDRCLERIEWPEGRFLELHYDSSGQVKSQKAPIGKDGEKRTLCEFNYDDDHVTKVYDALERKTSYRYSREHRVTEIKKHDKKKNLIRAEYFHWGRGHDLSRYCHDHSEEGHLLSKAIVDDTDKGLYCWKAKYDNDGNIIKETIYGNLSGLSHNHFKVDDDCEPKTDDIESYHKFASFYDDQFHMKKSESEDSGPTIKYSYKDGTNLLSAKYTLDGERIKIREFFSYDDDHMLIKKIADDGSSTDKNCLDNVSERRITKITPVKTEGDYGVGFPKEQAEYYFDLASNREVLLQRSTFTYDKAGRMLSQTVFDKDNVQKYTIYCTYNAKGLLTSKTDPVGRRTTYEYDKNHNKIREELIGSGAYTIFTYDLMNRLTKEETHYDTGDVFVTEQEYDLAGNVIKKIDHFGNVTDFLYDDLNRCIQVTLPAVESGRPTIKKNYDIFDKVISETDALGHTTTYKRTARGTPTLITYPDNSQERCEYNLNGTLKTKIEKNGLKHSYTYDFLRRPKEEKVYDGSTLLYTIYNKYNAFHLLSTTDPMGYITTYAYDGAGRKIEEKKVAGDTFSRTTYVYDSMGRPATTQKWISKTEFAIDCMVYDNLDRVILHETKHSSGTLLSKERFEYDILGNKTCSEVFQSENSSFKERTIFNSMNLLKEKTDALEHKTTYAYNFNKRNALRQNVLEVIATDPLGEITITTFDAQNHPVTTQKMKSSVLLAQEHFQYDLVGNKIKQVEDVIVSGTQERSYTISWKYDACNRPVEIIEQEGTSDEKKTRNEYTLTGVLKTIYKPNGVVLNHNYDALNRLVELASSDSTVHYLYTYDLNNNLLTVEDKIHSFTQHKTYDAWNRLTQEDFPSTYVQYSYDPAGRVSRFILPSALSISYQYTNGHLTDVIRLDASNNELYRHTYSKINLCEEVVESILPKSAGKMTTTWDVKGRTVDIEAPNFHEKIPADYIDACDNVKQLLLADATGTYTNNYTYDDLYQITSETGLFEHSYTNDSIANRRKKDANPYTIDLLNRVQSDNEATFTYDKNGNTISATSNGKTTRYQYDALDRLIYVETDSLKAEYLYDSLNRRLQKKVSTPIPGGWKVTKDEKYLYLGKREIGSLNSSNELQEFRVIGRGKGAEVGASVAIELKGVLYIPIHDGRGNIVELLSSTGSTIETIHYSAFGEFVSDTHLSPWSFVSKRYDSETDFFYFGSRYYSATLGRWVTADPLGFADGPNLYAYVHNSPLILVDPYGLFGEETAEHEQLKSDVRSGDVFAEKQNGTYATTYQDRPATVYTREASLARANASPNYAEMYMNSVEGTDPYIKNRYVEIKGPNGPMPNGAKMSIHTGWGITLGESMDNAIGTSNSFGGYDITLIYNHSDFIAGGIKFEMNSYGIPTEACYLNAGLMREWVAQNPNVDIYSFLHSHGALQGKLGMHMISSDVRGHMNVVTIGPAALIYDKDLKSLHQLASAGDPIPKNFASPLVPLRMRSWFDKTIEVLEVDPAASKWFDHACLSPTYQKRIEKLSYEYLGKNRGKGGTQ